MPSNAPLVSVIIPNYNHRRFLAQRIESVLNQTFDDFEVIYLDDASTDGSEKVFEQYADDERMRSYHNLTNSGNTFIQWNKGVGLAKGKYIWMAEADDYAEPSFLEQLVPILEKHEHLGVAYAQSYEVDEEGEILNSAILYTEELDEERWKNAFIADGRKECAEYLYKKNTIPNASAVVFRKEIFERVGRAPTGYKLCGDWHFWAKMLLASDIAFIAEHLNYYRSHGKSVRQEQTQQGRHFAETLRVRRFIAEHADVRREDAIEYNRRLVNKAVRYFFDGKILPLEMLSITRHGLAVDPNYIHHAGTAVVRELVTRSRKGLSAFRGEPDEHGAEKK